MAKFVPRRQLAKGVLIDRGKAMIVFVSNAGHIDRRPANDNVHQGLLRAWREANAWMVGAYVIMPDHLHFFCSLANEEVTIEQWITFWKRASAGMSALARRDSNQACFTTGCGRMRATAKSGSMSPRIQSALGSCKLLPIGRSKVF